MSSSYRQWNDLSWDGHGRRCKVNGMLGKIVHYYYPGMVVVDGVPQAATKWKHWSLKEMDDPDSPEDASETQSCASLVWQEF